MTIDRYAVIGNPVAQSKSPIIHSAFAQATGQTLTYERLLAPRDDFVATVERFVREGGKGLNVTIPFKLEAFEMAQRRSPRAEDAAAVNTLKFESAGILGDNTDGAGLVRDLSTNLEFRLRGARVLLLGAGGAARGVLARAKFAAPLQARGLRTKELFDGYAALDHLARLLRGVHR